MIKMTINDINVVLKKSQGTLLRARLLFPWNAETCLFVSQTVIYHRQTQSKRKHAVLDGVRGSTRAGMCDQSRKPSDSLTSRAAFARRQCATRGVCHHYRGGEVQESHNKILSLETILFPYQISRISLLSLPFTRILTYKPMFVWLSSFSFPTYFPSEITR